VLLPAAKGGHINLDTWRTREWYPALEAAGIDKPGPYHLRHTFRHRGPGQRHGHLPARPGHGHQHEEIDKTYGHLAHDSEGNIHAVLNAPRRRSGVDVASGPDA
jgi:hypothetical protein